MAAPAGSFRFVFSVDGHKQLKDTLGIATNAVKDWRPAFDQIHDDFTDRVMPSQFGSVGAGTWQDYWAEPRYAAMKRGVLGQKPFSKLSILRWAAGGFGATKAKPGERLYPSLTQQTHKDHVYNTTPHRFSFGTRVPYAKKLQRGGYTQKWDNVTVPARKIIDIKASTKLRWARMLQAYFMSAVGAAGRVAGRGGAGRQSPTFKSYKKVP